MDPLRYLLLLCALLLLAPAASAARLEIPLRVPLETVRDALAARLGASPAKPNEVWREGACRYLNLEAPKLEAHEGYLRLSGPGAAALGLALGGRCQSAVDWQGSMQFTLVPHIDPDGRLRVRILDSRLVDAGGGRTPGLGVIWDLSKRHLHPRLERFSYDLGASREALLGVLRGAAPAEQAAAMEQALAGLQVLEPRIEGAHVVVPVAFDVPDAWLAQPPPAAAAAPLSEAEIEALERAMEPFDAFLVYSIRQVALDSADSLLRRRLFTLLLDSRYRLSAILSGEEPAAGDPLRALFLDAWNELRAILVEAQAAGTLDATALRYAVFVDAGDALLALERAAPGLGMRPSAAGLRQLARSLRPHASDDPLEHEWAQDQELRRLFDVEELAEPQQQRSWLDFFVRRAHAAEGGASPALDRWVPTRDELDAYESRVGELLKRAAGEERRRATLTAPYDRMYEDMVPTTALIESCWRQYVVKSGKVIYLRSPVGSVGIMQINQRVWRGFYDVERLRWDTAYNARAGAQILMRYMKDYAIPFAQKSGKAEHAARAAYSVYNAGPRAVGRFAKATPHPREARVDEKLWKLYQGIAGGGQPDLKSCGVR